MTNYFLKVDKKLFNTGLNPLEILIVSQVAEFNTNTGDCFISDKTLAENFGVSESTIKRELRKLEELGYITRETKNIKGGKERHMAVNTNKITSVKMSLVNNNKCQNEPCTSIKMSLDKGQIDTIKDNIKDKEKDNNGVDKTAIGCASAVIINSQASQQEEAIEIDGQQAQVMTREEAQAKYGLSACANRISTGISNCYWIKGELVKLL